ncbi:MAG: pseudaminic acid biosynthesis-associated methylase [Eubacterium sp.]|jgi:pseudaminic acid biosynthesis-associated methylase|nr:pseudaminic acid biosynthesis-associated methylase [Eubacterium sp.]
MAYKTEQEEFWSGEFGDAYIERNDSTQLLAGNIGVFSEIIQRMNKIDSVIEFGSNIGMNLKAIKTLVPQIACSAIEINHKAAEILKNDAFFNHEIQVYEQSILEYEPEKQFDFVLIKGVLIHINPDELQEVYRKLYESSKRYICIAEYYNPTPVTVQYRGNSDRLFKRDFAGEFMDKYPDTALVDYKFNYHRDYHFPQDDSTWFLLEKR